MTVNTKNIHQSKVGKELYDYQHAAIDKIFVRILEHVSNYNLLYQLPTGGGKTVIFSEIARRYIQETGKKVVILTHRIELCVQTANMLNEFGVYNKIINSQVKELPKDDYHTCYVAMVETLNNRLNDAHIEFDNVGLIIIDEAHYNSFRKLFKFFENSFLLGVTATPLSSNIKLPMNENYKELIVGEDIGTLIEKGFLSKATTYSYNVGLQSLKIGMNGDYTVSSSENLYMDVSMQNRLLLAYIERADKKKTLIFNSGINSSRQVYATFKEAGQNIRHLDNTHSKQERTEILKWFKEVPGAILTSVSILTTGFDEPTVETIILNRATRSLTLYFQMIGRGSRIMSDKSTFEVIDLGNNVARFGKWEAYVNWHEIFRSPNYFLDNLISDSIIEEHFRYEMTEEMRGRFGNTMEVTFDIKETYKEFTKKGLRAKLVLEHSIKQHLKMCIDNSKNNMEAIALAHLLTDDIAFRVKQYSHCLSNCTKNYVLWLEEEYKRKLRSQLQQWYLN